MLPAARYRLEHFKKKDHIHFDRASFHRHAGRSMVPYLAPVILFLALVPAIKMFLPIWLNIYSAPFDKFDKLVTLDRTVNFLLEPNISDTIQVIVMVNSHPSEFSLREDIRVSWGNRNNYDYRETRLVFLLGKPDTPSELDSVHLEQGRYEDILVTDMPEDYYLLSLKTYAMLYYKKTRLPKTRCLVKADSDNVLNLHNYEKLCEETIAPRIVGSCAVDTKVLRNKSKWAIPVEIYSYPRWPTYCSTGTYMFCGHDVAELLLDAAQHTPFLLSTNFRRLPEDVLFTGIFAETAGVRRKHVGGMTFRDQPVFLCRETKYTYSIHMHRKKRPIHFHARMRAQEGASCLI